MIIEGTLPFIKSDKTLEDILPDPELIKHLRNSRKNLPAINTRFPDATTVVLWHRDQKTFMRAMNSASRQVYPGIHKVKFLYNQKDKYNVPQGLNELVRSCDTEYVNFLGDDDTMQKELLLAMTMALEAGIRHKHPNPVCAVSRMTLIDDSGKRPPMAVDAISPGMWRRDWLLEHPFDETVTEHVTYNYFKTMQDEFGIEPLDAFWNFGYFYHQGKDNMSGNKFDEYDKRIEEEKDGTA